MLYIMPCSHAATNERKRMRTHLRVMGQDLSSPAASMACDSANVSADLYISAACRPSGPVRSCVCVSPR